jgi:hypothetical protein
MLAKKMNVKMWLALLICNLITLAVLAQDTTTSSSTTSSTSRVSITTEEGAEWYTSPWVWLIGAAVFILLLVALLRGGGDRRATRTTDRVTHEETIRRDTDVD